VNVSQAAETEIDILSDAALQREILRSRRALFREEAERARRMMEDRELWARERAAIRLAERRRMLRVTAAFLCLLVASVGLFTLVLPDVVDWLQGQPWYPRAGD
jgi:hypothetical protein